MFRDAGAMVVTVAGSVVVIGAVTYVHADIPLLNSLYSLQLPLCLFVFVTVKSIARRCIGTPPRPDATLPEIYACMRVVVTEMYATFVVLLAVKLFIEGADNRARAVLLIASDEGTLAAARA